MADSPYVTWDGTQWRPYRDGDESLPGVLRIPFARGTAALDPAMPVITMTGSQRVISDMHDRWRYGER